MRSKEARHTDCGPSTQSCWHPSLPASGKHCWGTSWPLRWTGQRYTHTTIHVASSLLVVTKTLVPELRELCSTSSQVCNKFRTIGDDKLQQYIVFAMNYGRGPSIIHSDEHSKNWSFARDPIDCLRVIEWTLRLTAPWVLSHCHHGKYSVLWKILCIVWVCESIIRSDWKEIWSTFFPIKSKIGWFLSDQIWLERNHPIFDDLITEKPKLIWPISINLQLVLQLCTANNAMKSSNQQLSGEIWSNNSYPVSWAGNTLAWKWKHFLQRYNGYR